MVDTRFHDFAGPLPLRKLLAEAGEESLVEDDRAQFLLVAGADELALANPREIALAANRGYAAELQASRAGAIIVAPELAPLVPPGSIAVVSPRPHELFAELLNRLYPEDTRAVTAASAAAEATPPILEPDVLVGANVVLGSGVEIGRNTVIGANTVIGSGVAIGRDCVIGSNCTILCAYLGNSVVVHAGARIGTEGFGWLGLGGANRKIPQLGRVIIQDRVEIGANSTIDRGALGDTVVGEGTKIDNLVQIGHNCRIGRSCLIAATTGLSGSTVLGDGVLLGGGVGTSGHLTIGSGSIVHGRAAVTKDWPAGSKLAGAPAQDIRDFWKELAVVRRLAKRERG